MNPTLSFGKFRTYIANTQESKVIIEIEDGLNAIHLRLRHAEDALSEIARGEPAPHVVAENYFRNYNLTSLNYSGK